MSGVAEMTPKYSADVATNSVPVGYKQTEVGVIPEDWGVKTVFELADYQKSLFDDGDWIEAEHITNKGIRLIQTGNIGVGRYVEKDTKKYIFEESFEKLKCKKLHEGDLLICRLAEPAGRACILPDIGEDKVITSVDVTIFRPSTELANREFYNQYFSSSDWFKSVLEQVGGTTHKRISRGALGRISVCYPNVEEQTAIAKALSDVDALISELEKLIAKKQAIKTATMQQLLTGRTRLPQFALREDGSSKGTEPSELGEIPEDWEVVPFGNTLAIRHGKNQKAVEKANGTIPIFATGGQIGWADQYLWNKPSVLIGRKGTIDKPRYADQPFWTVDTLFYSEIKDCADPKFIFYKFCMIDWMQYNEASGVPSLNASTIEHVLASLPPKEEQTAIATILSDMDSEIQALEQRLGKTRQIKQGMMQELLTGKTRLIKGEAHG